ncbi:hypothetical protein QTA58_19045 [Neorhizobium sp. CSC1952]|uniref:Uncharacterized protein n=1 Tax=Xaviernesmea oryzae TaxID=464029 RepID=A0A1X7GL98_9HYPH|nr:MULTISPECIES: hypothetical protein [Rhizobium/Agrobacterium group]WJR66297.1 hypothetical protein QTA58_19045 [Rhizobium sp. CSC1952]SMF71444.1 hypothetical protein SAMN02982989_4027 [Xaviernesmea oryzae]
MSRSIVTSQRLPLIAAVSLFLLGIAGVAFYGWLLHGSSILLALGERGLSWCF